MITIRDHTTTRAATTDVLQLELQLVLQMLHVAPQCYRCVTVGVTVAPKNRGKDYRCVTVGVTISFPQIATVEQGKGDKPFQI